MNSSRTTTEQAFEQAIEKSLIEKGGYAKGEPSDFSRELAFDSKTIFVFLKDTQPQSWGKLSEIHGTQVESKVLQRLFKELDNRGTLDVLRNGFVDYGVRFKVAYFKSASKLNPETIALYNKNRLTVTRQVKYSLKNENSIDMLLSLNGLPVATVELKNQFTGQNAANAKWQYAADRDPNELLFKFTKRAFADKYFFTQIEEELVADEKLSEQAKNNSIGNFKFGFEDMFQNKLIERMDSNLDIFTKIMDDTIFGDVVKEWMLCKVYNRLNEMKPE